MMRAEADDSDRGGPAVDESTRPAIRLTDFSLSAGGRVLLEHTSADFAAGSMTLIVGFSGVGKSLLLRILAGLIDSESGPVIWSGRIERGGGRAADSADASRPERPAVVFQNFALLDELSPEENIEIAVDHTKGHRADGNSSCDVAAELLEKLGVPTDRPVSVLSGGQQQRLAIARALATDADVILYDEPTSGLDAVTSERVADLIRSTQKTYGRTAIIVTHDFAALLKDADDVYVVNHATRRLERVPPDAWNRLRDRLGTPPSADEADDRVPGWRTRAAAGVAAFLERSGRCLEEILLLPWSLLPLWKSLRWGLRSTRHYVLLAAGPSACLYIIVAGIILGFVAQDFIFRYLPFRQYTEPLLIENLLHATGFSLYRFLVPILCTILIAARSGAAVAADVGSKVYGHQMDAMMTIGMNPRRALRTPILYAFLLGTPLLTLLSYAAASLTAAVAFTATHPDEGIAFWDAHFHRELRDPGSMVYHGTGWLLAKLICCALGIGMIAWACGSTPKKNGPEISVGVTRSILWSTLFVLFVHFVFSLLEFRAVQ